MPPKQWIPVRFGARVLKSDIVAENIVGFFGFLKKNMPMFLGVVILLVIAIYVLIKQFPDTLDSATVKKRNMETRMISDKVMLDLMNNVNTPGYDSILNTKINDIDSENLDYLGFLLSRDDKNYDSIMDLLKNNIENEWLKTQAFLISGDNHSDNGDLDKAKDDYKKAIEYAQSNAQKGYSNYKLGNIYFELDDLENALSSFEKADDFFESSKENQLLDRNEQFTSWVERNSIALSKTKNKLKK